MAAQTEDREPLSSASIVAGAIEMADVDGLGAISMRKLARHLGYEVMSLYNHVANKDELLALMVDAVAAEVETPPDDVAPLDAVRAMALSLRSALVGHPWAPGLWQRQHSGPERTRVMEDLLRLLDTSELSPTMAHHGFHAVSNHVIGYTIQELDLAAMVEDFEVDATRFRDSLSPELYPHTIKHVNQHLDGDSTRSFELVLDLILEGISRLSKE